MDIKYIPLIEEILLIINDPKLQTLENCLKITKNPLYLDFKTQSDFKSFTNRKSFYDTENQKHYKIYLDFLDIKTNLGITSFLDNAKKNLQQ